MIRRLFFLNLQALGANYLKTGGKRAGAGKKILFSIASLYVVLVIVFSVGALFQSFLTPFYSAGLGWVYFAFLAATIFAFNLVSTIFTASAQLFGAKDNEFLLAMPIRPSAVLISRLLVILFVEYMFTFILSIPAIFVWVRGGYAKADTLLFALIGIALLPLLAMAAALLLSWILGAVMSKLRHKNIVVFLLSIGFLLGYFYIVVNMQSYLVDLISKGTELAKAFRRAMPPFHAFGRAAADGSMRYLLMLVIWTVLPFAAAIVLLAANYQKVLITNRGVKKIVYKEKKLRSGSPFAALVRKEMAHFWNKPFVVLNSTIGSILMFVVTGFLLVKGQEYLLSIDRLPAVTEGQGMAASVTVILLLLSSFNVLSASLISLEGKNLWLVKSLPVTGADILRSKLAVHLLVSVVPCLISSICAGIVLSEGAADFLLILLLPQAAGCLIAVLGLALNLQFPKLEWTNEISVVKQGLSAMLTMFGTIGILITLSLLYAFVLGKFISFEAFLWIGFVLAAAAAGCIYTWLMKAGAEKLRKI